MMLDQHIHSTVSQREKIHGVYRNFEITEVRCGAELFRSRCHSFSKWKENKSNSMISTKKAAQVLLLLQKETRTQAHAEFRDLPASSSSDDSEEQEAPFSTLSKRIKAFKISFKILTSTNHKLGRYIKKLEIIYMFL